MAQKRTAPGWRPGGGRAFVCGNGAHDKPEIAENQSLAISRLRLHRLIEALHARGPRPCGEVLAFALRRLELADQEAVLDQAEQIVAFPPELIRALGADCYARPPLGKVA